MNLSRARISDIARNAWLLIKESVISFQLNEGLDRSAALAYYCFLSLIPLFLLELFIATTLIRSSATAVESLQTAISRIFPLNADFIMDEVCKLSLTKSWGLLTFLVLLWSATPLAAGLRSAFQAIFKPEETLHFAKAKLLDVMAILGTLIILVTILSCKVIYTRVFIPSLSTMMLYVIRLIEIPLPFLVTMAILILFYKFFARVRLKKKYLLIGSFITALLLYAVGPFFSLILKYQPEYGVAFGSLKTVFLLFVWIYYSFMVILFGTEFMANMARRDALILRGLFTEATLKSGSRKLLSRFISVFADGQEIFREGEEGAAMYHVINGSVNIVQGGRTFRTMRAGEYFGEMAMLLETPRTMTAVAAEPDTELVVISRRNLDMVIKDNPSIVISLLKEMASRLKATNEKLKP